MSLPNFTESRILTLLFPSFSKRMFKKCLNNVSEISQRIVYLIIYVSDNNQCYLSLYLIWNTEQNTNFFVNNQPVGLAPKLSWRILYNNHKNRMADAKEEHTLSSAFFFKSTLAEFPDNTLSDYARCSRFSSRPEFAPHTRAIELHSTV